MARKRKNRRRSSSNEGEDEEEEESSEEPSDSSSDEYDEEANWGGGAGFDLGSEAHKWKSTRKFCCWPLYSESITLTQNEIHIKRNECPALPRECRPFRGWAVASLINIRGLYMRKTLTGAKDCLTLFIIALAVGIIGGGIVSALIIPAKKSVNGLEEASSVLGFNLDSGFFIFVVVIFVASCCIGGLVMTLRAPLRLVVNVEGAQGEQFGIDLIPGRVQPEEIKAKIDEFLSTPRPIMTGG